MQLVMVSRFNVLKAFKLDLAAAGIAEMDSEGRNVDFHGLRHTFITSLAAAGVHPKTAQVLARHSTISLTLDKYTHTLRGDEARALASLPDYSQPAAAMLRTGTDDMPAGRPAAMAPSRPVATLAGGMDDRSTGGADAANRPVGGLALGDHIDDPACRGAIRGAQCQNDCLSGTVVNNRMEDSPCDNSPPIQRASRRQ